MMQSGSKSLLSQERLPGVLLVLASVLSLIVANSALAPTYNAVRDQMLTLGLPPYTLSLSLLEWVNEGLMAFFFLLIALEVKLEFYSGKLHTASDWMLPAVGAFGGMLVPALIFLSVTCSYPELLSGWGIPTATDVAFSLGICAFFARRLPSSLRIFLMTLCILDDIGAILIVAIYYTVELSPRYLLCAAMAFVFLWKILPRLPVRRFSAYVLFTIAMWLALGKGGVSPTLAGCLLALALPMENKVASRVAKALQPVVNNGIVPLFAFMNLGTSLSGMTMETLSHPVALGVGLGLFFGKPLGITGAAWALVRGGYSKLPEGATWKSLWGVTMVAGIGFTMSLFVTNLAFGLDSLSGVAAWVGIMVGSLCSAICGSIWLYFALARR